MSKGRAELRGSLLTLGQRAASPSVRSEVRQVLRDGVALVVEAARSRWPVDTGYSRDHLDVEQRGDQTAAVGRAPYTTSIVTRGGVQPWRDYIVEPLRAAVKGELVKRVGEAFLYSLRVR